MAKRSGLAGELGMCESDGKSESPRRRASSRRNRAAPREDSPAAAPSLAVLGPDRHARRGKAESPPLLTSAAGPVVSEG